jgi:hypothetical protein
MSIKYLYGRLEHLGKFLDGAKDVPENAGIRFCDIIHYKTMENEIVRDDESRRVFNLDKERFTIEVNGKIISSESLIDHPGVELPVPRCFCLCLSNKKDDPVMFDRFKADVCIAVDTENLISFLTDIVAKKIPFRVLHGDINYYPKVMTSAPPVEEALIFYKDEELYSVEAEYRIALLKPETVYLLAGSDRIDVLEGDEPSYMFIGHKDQSIWSHIFKSYTKLADLG